MIRLVYGETLLDIGRERTVRALVRAWRYGAVVAVVPVQIPLVRRPEVAVVALDHRHRVVLDVLGVPSPHVSHVVALHTPEEFLLQVRRLLVPVDQRPAMAAERANGTPDEGHGRLFHFVLLLL